MNRVITSLVFYVLCFILFVSGSSPCGEPPAISGGTSKVVNDDVTYTCNTGYSMIGKATNVTCYNSTWEGDPPECKLAVSSISLRNDPKVYNNFHLQAVPPWLLYLIGVVGGCAGLLLLCCTVAVCLRCLGCWGTWKRHEGDFGIIHCCCVRHVKEDKIEDIEDIQPGEAAKRKKASTVSLPPEYTTVEKKKAKQPIHTWMPHQHEVRPFNTSTK